MTEPKAAEPLEWTTDEPTKPGTYVWRIGRNIAGGTVKTVCEDEKGMHTMQWCEEPIRCVRTLLAPGGWWLGPLPEMPT